MVTQLIEMGNPDAAIATTKAIPRWRPRNVLMVGIAGGVKGKAALGDVVVSQYAHYYEPGKRNPSRPSAVTPLRPSSSATTTRSAGRPRSTARRARAYCRWVDSVFSKTCRGVDRRT
jgi:nucleoside phosphorylase